MSKSKPRILLWKAKRRVTRRSEGERLLLERYASLHGKPLNQADPQTFTEKLYCRMIDLNRGDDRGFTRLTDKYAVRPYVVENVGAEHLVELLWDGTRASDIPFERLPEAYVIKTNHGSAQNIIVTRQHALFMGGAENRLGVFDRDEIVDAVSASLQTNYYWNYREYQYFNIEPRIMIEASLRPADGSRLFDYKYWCFNGVPAIIQVDDNYIWDMNPMYDTDWNLTDLYYRGDQERPPVEKPQNLAGMNAMAAQLAMGFDFVRIDLYNVDGHVYFGEFTFTPTAGTFLLHPEGWDLKLGEMWDLVRT